MTEPITNLEDAVAELGALPMPVGQTPQPMSEERLQEIAESHPGDWYSGAWTTEYYQVKQFAEYLVKHRESDTVLAELPDWAGPIALFMADAHDAVPELLTEIARLRARVGELERHVTNEALDDAVKALRASKDQPAPLIVPDADVDTLPAWLYQRFTQDGEEWDSLYPEQREYWVHQARAVGRAVARGGFKSAAGDR